jgi:hypothetical protein
MVVVLVDDGEDCGGRSGGIADVFVVLADGLLVTIMKEVECLSPFTIEGTGFIVACL